MDYRGGRRRDGLTRAGYHAMQDRGCWILVGMPAFSRPSSLFDGAPPHRMNQRLLPTRCEGVSNVRYAGDIEI